MATEYQLFPTFEEDEFNEYEELKKLIPPKREIEFTLTDKEKEELAKEIHFAKYGKERMKHLEELQPEKPKKKNRKRTYE